MLTMNGVCGAVVGAGSHGPKPPLLTNTTATATDGGGGGLSPHHHHRNKAKKSPTMKNNKTSPGIPDLMETYRKMMNTNQNYSDQQSLNIFGDSPLSDVERRFLHAAESGNLKIIKACVEEGSHFNVNCVDILGRTALQLAVIQEHIDIIQFLLGRCKLEVIEDAFLHAIKNGYVRICELFLNHSIYTNTQQRIQLEFQHGFYDHEDNNSDFSPDITPMILAAHCNNFDIVFLLIQRGFYIQTPHHYFCTCTECNNHKEFDRVVHSRSRLNAYKGLASTAYMSLSSDDPIMTAFELSEQLSHLANKEKEYKNEYKSLSEKCKVYAYDLLDLCRTESEVMAALHGNSDDKNLSRINLALKYEQKRFIAHASCQEHLMSIWYSDLPWFKNQSLWLKIFIAPLVITCMPIFAVVYFMVPYSRFGRILRIPIVKFLNHACSYFIFLGLLFAATTIATDKTTLIHFQGSRAALFGVIGFYVLGMFWAEVKQLWEEGYFNYFNNIWNLMDIMMIALYTAAYTVWIIRDIKIHRLAPSIGMTSSSANVTFLIQPDPDNPQIIKPSILANILFSLANVLTFARVAYLLPATEMFGQLQISYGRMIQDVLKFIAIYSTMMVAFICGLTSLYREYDQSGDDTSRVKNEYFSGLLTTFNTLFWSTFGLGTSNAPRLVGSDSTVALTTSNNAVMVIGYILYGVYIMFAVVVLINMLIAMMSNTFEEIRADEDVEWKFARAKLWLTYFDDGTTIPVPFNIIPTPKSIVKILRKIRACCCCGGGWRDSGAENNGDSSNSKMKIRRDYKVIMRRVVMRFVHTMKLGKKKAGGTSREDILDFKEEFLTQLEGLHAKLDKKLTSVSSTLHFVEAEILNLDKTVSKILATQNKSLGVDDNDDGDDDDSGDGNNDENNDSEEEQFVFGVNKKPFDPRDIPDWNKGTFIRNPNKDYGQHWSKYEEAAARSTKGSSTTTDDNSDCTPRGGATVTNRSSTGDDPDSTPPGGVSVTDRSMRDDYSDCLPPGGVIVANTSVADDYPDFSPPVCAEVTEQTTGGAASSQNRPQIRVTMDEDRLLVDHVISGDDSSSIADVHSLRRYTGSDSNLINTSPTARWNHLPERNSPGRLSDRTHDRHRVRNRDDYSVNLDIDDSLWGYTNAGYSNSGYTNHENSRNPFT